MNTSKEFAYINSELYLEMANKKKTSHYEVFFSISLYKSIISLE